MYQSPAGTPTPSPSALSGGSSRRKQSRNGAPRATVSGRRPTTRVPGDRQCTTPSVTTSNALLGTRASSARCASFHRAFGAPLTYHPEPLSARSIP